MADARCPSPSAPPLATGSAGPRQGQESRRDFLRDVLRARAEHVAARGPAQGLSLPAAREAPTLPFLARKGLILEIKRASPSKGDIAPRMDAVLQAKAYRDAGAQAISVLTEATSFGGSLADLVAVKAAVPGVAILRKDFLTSIEDVRVSHRAGADAILLLAGALGEPLLADMLRETRRLGMEALVEARAPEEIAKALRAGASVIGLNARDLHDLSVDRLAPVRLKALVPRTVRAVYESGIDAVDGVVLAGQCGFHAALVGEAVSRDPGRALGFVRAFEDCSARPFWKRLFRDPAAAAGLRSLVKVCGLARAEDALHADRCGADALGFVFADSPRKAGLELLRALQPVEACTVAVVACLPDRLDGGIAEFAAAGRIDAIQFHGDDDPETFRESLARSAVRELGIPWYKAASIAEAHQAGDGFGCPRLLLDPRRTGPDAGPATLSGPYSREDLAELRSSFPRPWIAGKLGADNVGQLIRACNAELVDASSRLESSPGRKDPSLVRRFIKEAHRAVRD